MVPTARIVLLIGLIAAAPLAAAFAAPAAKDVISARQARLKDLGASFKTINDQLRQPTPDAAKIKAASAVVRQASVDLPKWFPAGAGPEAGVKTRAKSEIWADKAGFAEANRNFAIEAQKLQKLAASGDTDALKVQAKVVGQTCGTCHTGYRVKDN